MKKHREPANPSEVAHASQLASAAQHMIDDGHTVSVTTEPLQIDFGGKTSLSWKGAVAEEVADECPPYVALSTYALASYSQYL